MKLKPAGSLHNETFILSLAPFKMDVFITFNRSWFHILSLICRCLAQPEGVEISPQKGKSIQ